MRSRPLLRIGPTIAVLVTLSGCGPRPRSAVDWNDSEATELPEADLHPTALTGQLFSHDTMLGAPGALLETGGLLWVNDYAAPPYFHLYDLATGALVRSFGRKGGGPGEFTGVLGLSSPDLSGQKALVLGANDFTLLDADPVHGDPPLVIKLPEGALPFRGTAVGPKRIVALRQVAEGDLHLTLIHPDGSEIRTVDYEELGDDSIPIGPRYEASYNLGMCSRPHGEGFVIVQFFAGKVEYYDHDANRELLADVPFPTNGYFVRDKAGEIRADTHRLWYWSCAATDRYLYAQFSGSLRKASASSRYPTAQYIHVFDWQGKLRHVIKLDQPINSITVSPDDSLLLASAPDSAALYLYMLPAGWRKP